MPHTTYGLLKAIRSHEVNSPSVTESTDTGRPNACNLCHLDKTLAWSAEHLERWYAIESPELSHDETNIAASVLWLLRGDAGQRALIAWSMGWEPARQAAGSWWTAPFLGKLLSDPYDAVRYIAERSLRRDPAFEHLVYDYVGSAASRQQAAATVLASWRDRAQEPVPGDHSALLIDTLGQLQRDVVDRLHAERNDRAVNLRE